MSCHADIVTRDLHEIGLIGTDETEIRKYKGKKEAG